MKIQAITLRPHVWAFALVRVSVLGDMSIVSRYNFGFTRESWCGRCLGIRQTRSLNRPPRILSHSRVWLLHHHTSHTAAYTHRRAVQLLRLADDDESCGVANRKLHRTAQAQAPVIVSGRTKI